MSDQQMIEKNSDIVSELILSPAQIAEYDIQIATAKRYPRDVNVVFKDAVKMVSMSEEISSSCIYSLPRKNKEGVTNYITGPSIRLAEIITSCWGNIHAGIRTIPSGNTMKVAAEAVVWDLEKNIKIQRVVERNAFSTYGGKPQAYSEDMRTTTANAAASIAYRNAVFKIFPLSLVMAVLEEAKKVATGSAELLPKRIQKCLNILHMMQVTDEQVLRVLNKKSITDIDQDAFVVLIGLYNSIRDGEQTVDTVFGIKPQEESKQNNAKVSSATESVLNKMK